MKYEARDLDVKAAAGGSNGDGDPIMVDRFHEKTVAIHGTFVATVQVQGKLVSPNASTDWVNIGAALTAPGLVAIADSTGHPLSVTHVRAKTTAFTSGAPKGSFGGFDSRSE